MSWALACFTINEGIATTFLKASLSNIYFLSFLRLPCVQHGPDAVTVDAFCQSPLPLARQRYAALYTIPLRSHLSAALSTFGPQKIHWPGPALTISFLSGRSARTAGLVGMDFLNAEDLPSLSYSFIISVQKNASLKNLVYYR